MIISPPSVLVSILNWNQPEKTIKCITSVKKLEYANLDILVVDNASTDDSVYQIHNAFPDIRLICSDDNLGYAGGNELALKVALASDKVELFWILNNDTEVLPDTLSQLIVAYQEHREALYGGVPVKRVESRYVLHMRVWENKKFRRVTGIAHDEYYQTSDVRFVEALSGSHLLIPLSIVRRYGFIDTTFFLYSEDTDYCFHLRQNGVKLLEVPQSIVIHDDGGSHKTEHLSRLKPIIHYYRTRNRIILFRRYFGVGGAIIEVLRQGFFSLAWIALTLRHGRIAFRIGYYMMLGISDGIRNHMGKVHAPEAVTG